METAKPTTKVNGHKTEKELGMTKREEFFPTMRNVAPFSMMRRFVEDMERMFEDWEVTRFKAPFTREPMMFKEMEKFAFAPQIETIQKDKEFIVHVDLPGINKDDVNIEMEKNNLIIRGERNQEKENKSEGFFRSERAYGSFYRSIPLPEGVHFEDVKAKMKDGVLEVVVKTPKQLATTKKIDIG